MGGSSVKPRSEMIFFDWLGVPVEYKFQSKSYLFSTKGLESNCSYYLVSCLV